MNSNFFHNLANLAMVVLAGLTAALLALGCTTLPDGSTECSQVSYISPEIAASIVMVLGVIKLAVNIIRDGITGLTKQQPPVE